MAEFKYRQLFSYYQQLISNGELLPGDKLPSVRVLSKRHDVSISTATKVLSELEKVALIHAKPKSGYFVNGESKFKAHSYGCDVIYKRDLHALPLAQSVQYSFNDESILPLSCTGPSTVLDNETLLNKLHRKVLTQRPYRLKQDNFEAGLPKLRSTLAQHLSCNDFSYDSENILITHGRSDALSLAITSLGLLQKRVAIEAPCSFFINANMAQLQIDTVAIPMQANYADEIALLDKVYQAEPFSAYVFNPNFNDPTGRLLHDQDKKALVAWAQARDVVLIEYDRGELYFSGVRPKSIMHFLTPQDKTPAISIGDFSDTISFSFSLGYMVCHQCIELCLFTKHITVEKPDMASQMMLNEMISSLEYRKLLTRLRKAMWQQYTETLFILQPLEGYVDIPTISGGPCLWLKLPHSKSSEALFKRLIKHNVAIAPGKMFLTNAEFDNYFRVTFALPWQPRMVQGLNILVQETLRFLES
ncbi:putative HTH-type transcriptional regulator YjiR [Pseudoalteromonas sp. P1-9]|uniref:aminotransferase-like domain-containing protein n=1 Tax=Pseudoalteromonas sp. P1-9 TaxID=1710354 RepID=UPI0006D5D406|nr:PLP-dependent aminotransferase family protein [Pseudoalteromonas sp. P1-9]KPV94305.1 putative HTH-type transcriptional regulator YjiR [Pseudoalteromonas sp. P1-9]